MYGSRVKSRSRKTLSRLDMDEVGRTGSSAPARSPYATICISGRFTWAISSFRCLLGVLQTEFSVCSRTSRSLALDLITGLAVSPRTWGTGRPLAFLGV